VDCRRYKGEGEKPVSWKRVKDCRACGQAGCVVNPENEKMGYCFRYRKTFFAGGNGKIHLSGGDPQKRKTKTNDGQWAFDFGKKSMYDFEQ